MTDLAGTRAADLLTAQPAGQPNLADMLERILDKGMVIAGDIRVNLLDIELLTIKLRLLIVSADRARELGIDWWTHDPFLSSAAPQVLEENQRLRDRVAALEQAALGQATVHQAAVHQGARRG